MMHNRSFINRRHREQDNKNIFFNFGFTHFILIFYSSLAGPFTSCVTEKTHHEPFYATPANFPENWSSRLLNTFFTICTKIFTHFDLHC